MNTTPDTYWDLFFGYGAIWLCVVVYLFKLQMSQQKLSKRLDDVEK